MDQEDKPKSKLTKFLVVALIVMFLATPLAMYLRNNDSGQTEEEYNIAGMTGSQYVVYCWSDKDNDVLVAPRQGVIIPEGEKAFINMSAVSNCTNVEQILNIEESQITTRGQDTASVNVEIEIALPEEESCNSTGTACTVIGVGTNESS